MEENRQENLEQQENLQEDYDILECQYIDGFVDENVDVIQDDGLAEINGSEEARASMFESLAKYFAEVTNPENNADNPFFKSKYAPLSEVLNTIRPVMGKYGLSIIQIPKALDNGAGSVQTILTHKDGAYISFPSLNGKPAKADIQGLGAVITYLRRFSINAIAGVAGEVDDDGNLASGAKKTTTKKAPTKTTPKATVAPTKTETLKKELISACATYVNNDAKKRGQVTEALKAVVANGNINNITTESDIKKALNIIKELK